MNTTSPAQRAKNHAPIDIPKPIFDLVHRITQEMRLNSGILTYDVFGYDVERNLAAILFQYKYMTEEKRLRVRHAYVLIGVDDGKVFGDFIRTTPPRIPHTYEMPPEKVVKWAESDLFQVPISELDKIIYQGNLALIPTRIIPPDIIYKNPSLPVRDNNVESNIHTLATTLATTIEQQNITSRVLTAQNIFNLLLNAYHDVKFVTLDNSYRVSVNGSLYETKSGFLYVDGTIEVVHTKGQYDTVQTKGLYKVVLVHHPKSPERIRSVLLC